MNPLLIPGLEDHRGLGILAGDWIKPDPGMTNLETRRYLANETRMWLTGRLVSHARAVAALGAAIPDEEMDVVVSGGLWPAARLYLFQSASALAPGGGGGRDYEEQLIYEEQLMTAANRAADVCCAFLLNGTMPPENTVDMVALEFVRTDRLPSGRVIASFCDHSPFEALRAAESLDLLLQPSVIPESSSSDSDDESDAETVVEEEAAEAVQGPNLSMDDQIEHAQDKVVAFAAGNLTVRYGDFETDIPVWAVAFIAGLCIAYLWTVVMILSMVLSVKH